jgi:hypothetical protein
MAVRYELLAMGDKLGFTAFTTSLREPVGRKVAVRWELGSLRSPPAYGGRCDTVAFVGWR